MTPANEADTGSPVSTSGEDVIAADTDISTAAETPTSTSGDDVTAADTDISTAAETTFGPAKGVKGFLQRSLLNRLLSTALEGAEPLNTMPSSSGPIGDQLLADFEDPGPMGPSGPMSTGPIDFANAPDLPGSSMAAPVDVAAANPVDMQVELTEMPSFPPRTLLQRRPPCPTWAECGRGPGKERPPERNGGTSIASSGWNVESTPSSLSLSRAPDSRSRKGN